MADDREGPVLENGCKMASKFPFLRADGR